jgi:flagellar biogenesis protein FliO
LSFAALQRRCLGLLVLMVTALVAQAQTTNALVAPAPLPAPSLTLSLFRVIGALALVLGIFLGGVWVFKNWQRLVIQKGRAPKLNVLEVRSLGQRHALYVIGYEQQRILLSSSPTGVTMLTHLPSADGTVEEPPAPAANFADTLRQALTRKP